MIYFYAIWGMLDLLAIILVINEDIFYEIEEKVFKIFWILLLPIIGALYAMVKLGRLHDSSCPKSTEAENIINYDYVDPHNMEL